MKARLTSNHKTNPKNKRLVISVIALLVIFAGLLFGYKKLSLRSSNDQDLSSVRTKTKEPATEREALIQIATAQTRHFKGSSEAPVTILEFSDFL